MRAKIALGIAALAAGCVPLGVAGSHEGAKPDRVVLQLKWVHQAQFAGYYAAEAKGFYEKLGLDVTIKPGGPKIVPEQVVLKGQAELGIDWLPSLLTTRDKGGGIVNIAQIFSRSGVTALTWKTSGITSFCQLRGKRVGVWLGGNEYAHFAALQKCGIDPRNPKDVTIVPQSFTTEAFLEHRLDAASAMTFNELAQVLEQKNPKTGKLFTLADLNVFRMETLGTGVLEDGIFAAERWLKDKENRSIARRFIQASLQGWIYCRDHPRDCVEIVLDVDPRLAAGHQAWQMNEVNALIWPGKHPLGVIDAADYERTVELVQRYQLVQKRPKSAVRTDLVVAASSALQRVGYDVLARGWRKPVVKATPGGR